MMALKRGRLGTLYREACSSLMHLRPGIGYLSPHVRLLVVLAACDLIASLIPIASPSLFRIILDEAYPSRDVGLALRIGCLMLALGLFVSCIRAAKEYWSMRLSCSANWRYQTDMYDLVQALPPSYYAREGHQKIIERVSVDCRSVVDTLLQWLPEAVSLPAIIVTSGVLMLRISAKVTFLVLAIIPVYYMVAFVTTAILRRMRIELRAQTDLTKQVLEESISGMETLRFFDRPRRQEKKHFGEILQRRLDMEMKVWRKSFLFGRLSQALTTGWMGLLTFGATVLMFRGVLTPGEVVSMGMYAAILMRPFSRLISLYKSLMDASVAAQRIEELRTQRGCLQSRLEVRAADFAQGLRIRNLEFAYVSGHNVLRIPSLDIPSGCVVSVVGANGSGKTTLLKVIAGYYGNYQGEVRIGGKCLNELDPLHYARNCALVGQDVFLQSDTILSNCRVGDDVTDAHIKGVAGILGFDEWIGQLENGYETLLGREGTQLSTGQRRKIAVLRALVANPPLLLIDELTSCLDTASIRAMLAGLAALRDHDCVTLVATSDTATEMSPWIRQGAVLLRGELGQWHGSADVPESRKALPLAY